MKDLQTISGLPISMDNEGKIVFNEELKSVKPGVRKLQDMRNVLMDKNSNGPEELYHMYRDIKMIRDEEIISKHNLRYDITVIKPGKIGQEYVKTAGHYHPIVESETISYPEVYEVLNGKAIYILQKMGKTEEIIEEIIIVEAVAGEQVCIPPNYGHVTVNPGDETLIMCNWVGDGWSSTYNGITKVHGAACFIVEKNGKKQFVMNKKCKFDGEMKFLKAKNIPEFGLKKNEPMYTVCIKNPDKFKFLNEPQNFLNIFEKALG